MDGEDVDSVPSELLPHIYTYLIRNNYHKSAKALQKNCGRSLAEQNGPGLLQFFSYYQTRHAGKRTVLTQRQEEEEEECPPSKRMKRKCVGEGGDDGDENGREVKKKRRKKAHRNATSPGEVSVLSNGHKESVSSVPAMSGGGEVALADQTEDSMPEVEMPLPPHRSARHLVKNSTVSDSENSDQSNPAESTAVVLHNDAMPTLVPVVPTSPASLPVANNRKRKRSSNTVTPFRRVAEDTRVDPRLQDNSFEAKAGSRGSWGEKAYKDLKFTKGKSFRHEKTKKKRGSYKGGSIDTSVCSIKFDSD